MNGRPSYETLPQGLFSSVPTIRDSLRVDSMPVEGRTAKGAVSANSLEEMAELLRAASKEKIAIIPRGSGTMMGLGNPPREVDLVLDLRRLSRVLEYNPENLTVTAECGLPLAGLQEILGRKGQFLPLDPPYFLSASLGGIVAANASGPKRLHFGTVRDMILGMRVALADGSVVSFGGRCVKNVSGLDMCKLFAGSLGTLGIIGELTFKVHPLPEQEVIQVGFSSDPANLLRACHSLVHSVLFPAALEILHPHLARIWCRQMGLSYPQQDWLILIGWVGFAEDVSRLAQEGQEVFSNHGVMGGEICPSDRARSGWEVFGQLPRHLEVPPEDLILCRMCLPLSALEEAIVGWQKEAKAMGCSSVQSIRAGSGILCGYLFGTQRNEERTVEALERLRGWALGLGGSLVVESAPLWLKKRLDVWGPVGKQLILMRRLKGHFDPMGVLNPGRYLGGI